MEAGVESRLRLRLLGPLEVARDGAPVALPPSRKVRGLLAYLALAPAAVPRTRLCELLWEVPDDPRGELRWSLSKLRGLVDEPGRVRVQAREDAVRLDLSGCRVDAIEALRAASEGLATLDPARRRALGALFAGDFLEGLEIDRQPAFTAWLTAQRRQLRAIHVELLERLAAEAPDDEALDSLEKWLQLEPFETRAHARFLQALARHGRIHEADQHVEAALRAFAEEGLDGGPIREAWRAARHERPVTSEAVAPEPPAAMRRASVAVMPFADAPADSSARRGIGESLAHDVITGLAQLRSLFVIAQGSVFALHERGLSPEAAGRMLGVDYVVAGSTRRRDGRLSLSVELADARSSRIVWAEIFNIEPEQVLDAIGRLGDRIVASIAGEIEAIERNRAVLRPPESLDAWQAHHRGLWHMYRFSRDDNEQARHFFGTAVRLDPTFARAHAGLSFTHFQNAFQGWVAPRERTCEADRALEAARNGLMADDRDPAAHWAMGRALWLREDRAQAVAELERAIDLSPNFALGHYTLGFVHSVSGDPAAAISAVARAQELSPFDPLMFAIHGSRAHALVRLERFEEAAEWAARAAACANAHAHIHAIAAFCFALAGSLDKARAHAAIVRREFPGYTFADFLATFRLDEGGQAAYRRGARLLGMD